MTLPLLGFAQLSSDSCFTAKERQAIWLKLVSGLECDSLLNDANAVIDSLVIEHNKQRMELSNSIDALNAEINIRNRVVDIERDRAIAMESMVKKERKKTVVTVGIASVISALCLFIAIK